MKTGVQISSLKPLIQTEEGLRAACEKLAALNCRTVQLQWLGRKIPVDAVARILEETGIRSVSVQDFYVDVWNDLEYYVNLNGAAGGTWLTVSRIPEERKSPEGLREFALELESLRQTLAQAGQKLAFHPVTGDFRAVPGMDAVDFLLEAVPQMDICLDLFHLNRNCDNMPGFIHRYEGRIPMVHFKDEDASGKLVPAGSGTVRWQGVVEACRESGVLWGLAEQETWEGDPFRLLDRAMVWTQGQL